MFVDRLGVRSEVVCGYLSAIESLYAPGSVVRERRAFLIVLEYPDNSIAESRHISRSEDLSRFPDNVE